MPDHLPLHKCSNGAAMNNTSATLFVIGLCCGWPLLWSVISVIGYKRYTEGGWRSVFFGKQVIK